MNCLPISKGKTLVVYLCSLCLLIPSVYGQILYGWTDSYTLSQARIGLAGTVFPNPNSPSSSVYLFGGSDGTNYTGSAVSAPINSWGVGSNTAPLWTPIAPMPTPRMGHKALCVNVPALGTDLILVLGGFDGSFHNRVEAYNPITNQWATLPPMNTARAFFAADVYNGRLIVAGGQGPSGPLSSAESLDLNTLTWNTVAPLPTARYGMDGVVYNHGTGPRFFVIGGLGSGGPTALVEGYDFGTGTWASYAPLSSPRAFHSATRKNSFFTPTILLSGGLDAANTPVDSVHEFGGFNANPEWSVFAIMTQPLSHHLSLTFASGHPICLYYNVGVFGGLGLSGPSLETEYLAYEISGFPTSRFALTAQVEDGGVELKGDIPGWEGRAEWWFERSRDNVEFESLTERQRQFPLFEGEWVEGFDGDLHGREAWYRMAVQMTDGTVEYSSAVHVFFDGSRGMDLGPVPAGDRLWVTPVGFESGAVFTLRISNMQGQVVLEKRKLWSTKAIEMETGQLFPGVYQISLQGARETVVRKFLKM